MRGDWQIVQWLFGRVPDETGKFISNPISTISRWKILDNLRRSLVEPITFIMLILGWFILPGGSRYWTIATLILLLLPSLVQFAFNIGRALLKGSFIGIRDSFFSFASSFGMTMLNLTFLTHQMLLSIDAIVRSLIRRLVSGKHMLEWETAAQSESGSKKTHLDIYLQLSPVVAVVIAIGLAFTYLPRLYYAAPILFLWFIAPLVSGWLNSPPKRAEGPLSAADRVFLQDQALHIWRFFLDFGDERNHWLIPDNVEEKNTFEVRKLSPTNLGMLFNTRQAAYEFGFITLPEFARASLGTLTTYDGLEKQRGHIYNWYDIETLKAVPPFTVSAVDSGNLAASLYTLHTGALDILKRPILADSLFTGIDLMRRMPNDVKVRKVTVVTDETSTSAMRARVQALLNEAPVATESTLQPEANTIPPFDIWVEQEAGRRHTAAVQFIQSYTPWLLPQFEPLFQLPQLGGPEDTQMPSLENAHVYASDLETRAAEAVAALPQGSPLSATGTDLLRHLAAAIPNLQQLAQDLSTITDEAERHGNAMEYGFLLVESRNLLSIGYDGATHELHSACYDLLASEARIASFLAVAKGDIPQDSWFRLSRTHVVVNGRAALLSWTGTMFEYLMPALWMETVPDTLIARSLEAAVQIQRDHVRDIPWGISESGFAKTDPIGRYSYQAWGIPKLALKYGAEDGPVISPYSTFLALPVERQACIANLRRMAQLEWVGPYGFYEAADYTEDRRKPQLVRSWMAHHQGMCLLAVTNLLRDNIIQKWFHGTPLVRAAELLLHEKPLSKETVKDLAKQAKLQEKGLPAA